MISGPMPSPGSTATFTSEVPGKLRFAPRLERADLVRVAQREADLVEAVEQAVLAERIDVEAEALGAVERGDALPLEVDAQPEPGEGRRIVEQLVDFGVGQGDRQEAVFQRIVLENLAERRRDDRAEAVVAQRPRSVLARGADAEILAREQDLRALVARLVEDELRILAPRSEAGVAEAAALDRLQVALRNDLVGIDVGAVERHDQRLEDGELVHQRHSRTSTKWPAIAAAAAMAGLTRCVRPPARSEERRVGKECRSRRAPS